jgi:hypothetical protein
MQLDDLVDWHFISSLVRAALVTPRPSTLGLASGRHSSFDPAVKETDLVVWPGTVAGIVPLRRRARMASLFPATSSRDQRSNAGFID